MENLPNLLLLQQKHHHKAPMETSISTPAQVDLLIIVLMTSALKRDDEHCGTKDTTHTTLTTSGVKPNTHTGQQ